MQNSDEKTYIIQCGDKRKYNKAKRILEEIGATLRCDWPRTNSMSASVDTENSNKLRKLKTISVRYYEAAELNVPNTHL